MTDPDELYTLRAQYWMGHYQLCLDEAKSMIRRPMSPELKAEREEFVQRAHLALGALDKVTGGTTGGLQALSLKAQYEQAKTEDAQQAIVDKMKVLLSDNQGSVNVSLYASQLFLRHGLVKDALQSVYGGTDMERMSMSLQLYLKLDRIDLAEQQLTSLRNADEDAVLCSLGSIHIALAKGRSTASDALHVANALSEQYGPSPLLLNLMACAHMTMGNYADAETRLLECQREHPQQVLADTYINLLVCSQYLGKDVAPVMKELQQAFPAHPYCQAFERVDSAFERESLKYKVKA